MVKKLEIMRKIVLGLMCWNLVLSFGLIFHNHEVKQETKLNQQICLLEEIPMEELK